MAKIEIRDLPANRKVSKKEMREVVGGVGESELGETDFKIPSTDGFLPQLPPPDRKVSGTVASHPLIKK